MSCSLAPATSVMTSPVAGLTTDMGSARPATSRPAISRPVGKPISRFCVGAELGGQGHQSPLRILILIFVYHFGIRQTLSRFDHDGKGYGGGWIHSVCHGLDGNPAREGTWRVSQRPDGSPKRYGSGC